jgi:Uma2 family endonuclease
VGLGAEKSFPLSAYAERGTGGEVKVPLYARAGIPEVWLVNLPADTIERFREPRAGDYADLHTARRGDALEVLRLPGVTLQAGDILG